LRITMPSAVHNNILLKATVEGQQKNWRQGKEALRSPPQRKKQRRQQ
jgi:hypothetical protein